MSNLQARVEEALLTAFHDGRPVLESSETGEIHGVFVSHSFSDKTDRERQQALWSALQRGLKPEELAFVRFILASTPAEQQSIADFPPDED